VTFINFSQFMASGDLLTLLRRDNKIDTSIMIEMSRQAASGMVYLQDRNIVHRDLALSEA
jgi:serine/threonine protein kinase